MDMRDETGRVYGRSIPVIITDLLTHLATLVRKEGELARAEVTEKITQASRGFILVAVGAVLLMPALVILLQAATAALAENGYTSASAALIVGGATLIIGLILLAVGASRLKAENLLPNKTIHQLQHDAAVAKQMRQDDDLQRAA